MIALKPFILLLSLLPLRILYWLSDLLFVLIYHVFTYRRVTVRKNLALSFPDMGGAALREIEKKFYRHFCDLIAEGVKAFSISEKMLEERVTVSNMEIMTKLMDKGISICGILGHMGNWEWAVLRLARVNPYPTHALYQPSSSRSFDRWMKKNRERFGATLVSTRKLRTLFNDMQKGPIAIGLLGDQGPVQVDKAYWTYFLHQPTPVYTGTAKLAVRHGMAVVYISITKPERGHYHIDFELMTDDARSLGIDRLSELHTRRLEADIYRQPEIWLWSHRRWKRAHLKPPHLN